MKIHVSLLQTVAFHTLLVRRLTKAVTHMADWFFSHRYSLSSHILSYEYDSTEAQNFFVHVFLCAQN